MKSKSEAKSLLHEFYLYEETQYSIKIKWIRIDQKQELSMPNFYSLEGIIHQTSCVSTSQQNSVVERKHQHTLNVARALKLQAHLPLPFWSDCALHAVHLMSGIPSLIFKIKPPTNYYIISLPLSSIFKFLDTLLLLSPYHPIEQNWILEQGNAFFLVTKLVLRARNCMI